MHTRDHQGARTEPLIAIPAEGLRDGRTGGQILWERLVDHLKGAGLPVLCEDERPVPSRIRDRPLPLALWYLFAYGGIRRGIVVADQSGHGRQGLLLRRVNRRSGIRVIMVVQHLREEFRYRNPLYVAAARQNESAVVRLADTVIVHTEQEARRVQERGVDSRRIRIIPLGIRRVDHSIEIRTLEENDPLRLLWIGGDFRRKGLDCLLSALAAMEKPRPLLRIVGLPHDLEILERAQREVERLGLAGSVSFQGRIPEEELEAVWGQNDVYVQPSLHEGHGLALDEALIRGMPAIASDLPAFRERLRSEDVLFVPPGDAKALQRALREIRPFPRRRELAARGRARARTFPSWESTLDSYEALIRTELECIP